MSGQPFSFPSPPPPPPKRPAENAYQQGHGYGNSRGSFRGGRAYSGNVRGGRGNYGNYHSGPPPPPPSSRGRDSTFNQDKSQRSSSNGFSRGGHFNPSQKRDHSVAFNSVQQFRSRPVAPPAVPNFNAPIAHLLTNKPSTEPPPKRSPEVKRRDSKPEPKKQNLLGLTPAKFEHDSDPEDDENEEQRLVAQIAPASGAHVFEYNGNPLLLRTRQEILNWIAERKKRYPTEARREAAKKEAEERRRKREEEAEEERRKRKEEYQSRQEAKKEILAKRDQERAERIKAQEDARKARKSRNEAPDDATQARLRAEKLRKKALKAQQELAEAEEALLVAQTKEKEIPPPFNTEDRVLPPSAEPVDTVTSSTLSHDHNDETSSSGSSTDTSDSASETSTSNPSDADADSDSAPEVLNTKYLARSRDSLLPSSRKPQSKSFRLCSHLLKYKRCKYGSSCHYSHDLSQRARKANPVEEDRKSQRRNNHDDGDRAAAVPKTSAGGNVKRKGLWQVMVEKEEEAKRKELLGVIVRLGERGVLDEPGKKPMEQSSRRGVEGELGAAEA